jgi:hypothetical protein
MTDTNKVYKFDDEIDEDFTSKPVVVNTPSPLSNEELSKVNDLVKNKSNKELMEYISQLVSTSADNLTDIQKLHMQNGVSKIYGNFSKKALIDVIGNFINEKNKYVVFNDVTQLKTMNEEQKLSREELRQKLRNKLKSKNSRNNNQLEQLEQLQKQLENSDISQILNQNETTEENNDNKPKKKKKINPKKLQNKLIGQMANLMKNNPSGFNGAPNSA